MDESHKRRVRYPGTHPRSFAEKYKELDPEKYQAEVQKQLESGRTPAGMHVPICVEEILAFLQVQPGQVGYDATLGYGGHSQRLLEALGGTGHLYATDLDPIESEKTGARLAALGFGPERLTIRHMSFAEADRVAPEARFDFVLADLGVSSMQLDNPARGFTYKREGPLDLRLDPTTGVTGAARLRELGYAELVAMLEDNADEPYAPQIARAILRTYKQGGVIETTGQLAAAVGLALNELPANTRREAVKKACQRTFQALRIDVNGELTALTALLEKLPAILAPGGRAAILTFHSGEDRLVKKYFQTGGRDGLYADYAREVVRPSAEECRRNPRAKPAKLRWAIRA